MSAIETGSFELAPADVQRFRRDGYLVVRNLFAESEVDAIRQTFMGANANGPVEGLSETRRRDVAYDPADPLARYPRMMHPHRHMDKPVGPVAMSYMLDPRHHAILRALFDDEPLAVQSMFYFKPPGARGQGLHQDNFYLRVRPGTCMAAWLAVDDADEENGGMVVVPGTQDMEIVCPEAADPAKFFTTEFISVPKGMKERPLRLKAGDVLYFNGSLVHGSYPNTSATRFRRALICHYIPQGAQELGKFYKDPMRFDRRVVQVPEAVGGGPCGEMQARLTAPH